MAALTRAPARLGAGRLLCVDGLAGSGKTSLATEVARLTGGMVLHTDEMLAGWRGLPGLADTLTALLVPLARDEASSWRRWDWHASAFTEVVPVAAPAPGAVVVVEGVGAAVGRHRSLASLVVWVEAEAELRRARGRERDGEEQQPYWDQWLLDEADLHARARTRENADLRFVT